LGVPDGVKRERLAGSHRGDAVFAGCPGNVTDGLDNLGGQALRGHFAARVGRGDKEMGAINVRPVEIQRWRAGLHLPLDGQQRGFGQHFDGRGGGEWLAGPGVPLRQVEALGLRAGPPRG
jgi:hypothetical protein